MANHSTILAWRIPWRGEPGGHSMGLQSQTRLKRFSTRARTHTAWMDLEDRTLSDTRQLQKD